VYAEYHKYSFVYCMLKHSVHLADMRFEVFMMGKVQIAVLLQIVIPYSLVGEYELCGRICTPSLRPVRLETLCSLNILVYM
jgi:hypothetical protein